MCSETEMALSRAQSTLTAQHRDIRRVVAPHKSATVGMGNLLPNIASCQISTQHRLFPLLLLLVQRFHTLMYRGNTTTQILPSLLPFHTLALSFPRYQKTDISYHI